MIVPSPVTTLNNGRVTDPVDIMTVLASATTSFFCGTISIFLISQTDPEEIDPESVDPDSMTTTGRIIQLRIDPVKPTSVDPVDTQPEEMVSGTITTQIFISPHELFVTTHVEVSQKTSDLTILTETSGSIISQVIIEASIF